MWKIKNKLRQFLKKIYYKLNPAYKYILHINSTVDDIEKRLSQLEINRHISSSNVGEDELNKIYLASDSKLYRYLYLERYIKENDRLLDIEGAYGTGVDLLTKYTPIDQCTCLNSINYYNQIGNMYYGSDYIEFREGNIRDIDNKYNIITYFDDNKTRFLTKNELKIITNILEYGGILALSFKTESYLIKEIIKDLSDSTFSVEEHFYQSQTTPELQDEPAEDSVEIYYLRKNA